MVPTHLRRSPSEIVTEAALVANPDKPVYDLEGIGKVEKVDPLLTCISITSGTAAEVTSSAMITDTCHQVKIMIIDTAIIPDIAVNYPTLLTGLPANVTTATGMDALTHTIESYESTGTSPAHQPSKPHNLPRGVCNAILLR
ncbi:iron-containing alcohol dehydrogenase [Celerinatantimonas diazotrophica]|uniref:iron-containing alcohol dehydrogenase n=1 Tax=Celerinatantimonas diazotrophica TaxID=412034 RepID=UPI001404B0DB|nr:iron-containing alcohol dehydrogenase [Celerinatantimonas diazotrophica]CAG9296094.1 hypothetical protein CEDIAZO_01237 [Celerinatantimonas diazotrophica]